MVTSKTEYTIHVSGMEFRNVAEIIDLFYKHAESRGEYKRFAERDWCDLQRARKVYADIVVDILNTAELWDQFVEYNGQGEVKAQDDINRFASFLTSCVTPMQSDISPAA